jgi:hypothetical protein
MSNTDKETVVPGSPSGLMTMNQFLTNPTGFGSAGVARRDIIRRDLYGRFRVMLSKTGGSLPTRIYKGKEGYIFRVSVPSEKHASVSYDVLIHSKRPEGEQVGLTVGDWEIQFFSNALNFTFTYAYVTAKAGLLWEPVRRKCSPESLRTPPKTRNPVEELGFEKSVYFTLLWLREAGWHRLNLLEAHSTKSTLEGILQDVATSEQKIKEYRAADKLASEGKKAAMAAKRGNKPPPTANEARKVPMTRKSSTTKGAPDVKQTKRVQSTKKKR